MNNFSQVKGLDQLTNTFKELSKGLDKEVIGIAFYNIARRMAIKMRQKVNKRSGNLRRGIIAKKFNNLPQRINTNYAFVGIDYRIASHAHLVEFGHKARNGKFVPARPFFRPVIDEYQNSGVIEREIGNAINKALDKVLKKKVNLKRL